MESHVFPYIGLRDITTLKTLTCLFLSVQQKVKKFMRSQRLQQRIAAVMRYAVQSGIIGYNPATAGAVTTVQRQHRPAL